jgi:hypothetical protein
MSGTLVALKKLEVFENLDEITSEIEFMKVNRGIKKLLTASRK